MKENITIHSLIIKGSIKLRTVYFLCEKGRFTIAVDWIEDNEPHFKIFKEVSLSSVKKLNDFLLTYDQSWHLLASKWIDKPTLPLKLNHKIFSENLSSG